MIMPISSKEYDQFRLFLEQASGIVLGEGKQYLISSRLTTLLEDENLDSMADLLLALQRNNPLHLKATVVDAMTTNETSWFRDKMPFECLEEIVFPEIDAEGKRQCRIWSSACSSGQEPYTISMTASEYTRLPKKNLNTIQIMATDISPSMVEHAKRAEYDESILGRGLSDERKQQFFKARNDRWLIADDVKRRVSFKEQNLLLNYDALGKFDIIFCRNVLIYFAPERKSDILNRMAKALNPKGYLFLGASESISNYSDAFDMVRSPKGVYYRLKD